MRLKIYWGVTGLRIGAERKGRTMLRSNETTYLIQTEGFNSQKGDSKKGSYGD